jgi:hypothetical protein
MKRFDPAIISIIVITVVILGGIILVSSKEKEPSIAQYKITDSDRPQLEIGETNFDFGRMKLSETKIKEAQIKNKGTKSLIISNALTSCDCTFVQFIIDGKESPKFSMGRNTNWRGEIKPNQSALLRIIYEPRIMPVKGAIRREIIFKTNDPTKPLVSLRFTAAVE